MDIKYIFNSGLRRDSKLLEQSSLFDAEFYAARIQQGEPATMVHFLTRGWKSGLNPSRFFDINFYLSQYPDVRSANINPVIHYIKYGWREKRSPHPRFNVLEYVYVHPDVDFDAVDPLRHCILRYGSLEWRDLLPEASSHANDRSASTSSFYSEIRAAIADEFDSEFYRSQGELPSGIHPIDHFIAVGWHQGRDPNNSFSVRDYLSLNPDVRLQNLNPFWHFLMFGRAEGRAPRIVSRRRLPISESLESILFVGHDGIKAGAEVVLLEIVRWFAEHTRRPLKVLLLADGIMASNYSEYAEVYVLHDADDLRISLESPALVKFMDAPFMVAYVNSVASGDFAVIYDRFLSRKRTPLFLHVHELTNVIREFEDEFRQIQPLASSMIAVSQRVKDCLIEDFGCKENNIFVSNAFIRPIATSLRDVAIARQKARDVLGVEEEDFVIMGCGTVYPRKGPDLFLDVATKILTRGSIAHAKFVWIGDGPDVDECRAQALDPALGGRVRFVGFRDDANALLAAADVFFLSSREDPFPLVCLEAAQFAIPTVYFEGASGISEFTRGDAGVGVPSHDTEKCCSVLRSLARRPATLGDLGATARARVLSKYSADIRCKQIAQHIQTITGSRPDVTVLVPVYNHADYIEERIDSILSQTIQDFEVIILDDCSTDSTAEIAESYTSDSRVRIVRNAANSGSPFKQWKRGLELAKSSIVWIAEGDDSASDNFLETLLPSLDDEQTALAFCSTEIMDCNGSVKRGALDPYYAQGTFPFYDREVIVDGFTGVELGFGAMCLIVNGSSTLMRKSHVMDIIDEAASFKMCGDWLVYLHALTKGKLYYSRGTTNYFRRHSNSTVHRVEGTEAYFTERHKILSFVVNNFNVSRGLFQRALALNENEWHRFRHKNPGQQKSPHLGTDALVAARKKRWPISPMRIGFYVHGMLFSKGGIERLAAELANSLSRRGHYIVIFCRVWGTSDPVYNLNKSVVVSPIFDENDLDNSVARMRLGVSQQELDCFVPMLSEWLFDPIVEAVDGLDMPILVSEHNDPWKIEELWWSRDKRIACFNRASAIHLLLENFRASLPSHLTPRVSVIPNGIRIDPEILSSPVDDRPKRFIAVGRLAPQKRFDRLIRAFARISSALPDWRLDIFGEGGEAGKLQKIIAESFLSDRVTLRGQSTLINKELVNSSVFVLPSEFEGFGIVVIEAKMAGLPTIAYANCAGPNELVRHNVDGLLSQPDEEGENLAAAMVALATNEDRRVGMATRARENIVDFDIERVVGRWEEILAKIVREHDAGATDKLVD